MAAEPRDLRSPRPFGVVIIRVAVFLNGMFIRVAGSSFFAKIEIAKEEAAMLYCISLNKGIRALSWGRQGFDGTVEASVARRGLRYTR